MTVTIRIKYTSYIIGGFYDPHISLATYILKRVFKELAAKRCN